MKALPIRSKNALFCLLVFSLFPAFVVAQAWNPFPGAGSYVYTFSQQGSPLTWLHGARIDSLGLAGGDTVYYFNKINRNAFSGEILNTCYGPASAVFNEILLEQEHHFGKEMYIRPNGDYDFVSMAGDTFRIKTQVPPGGSWTFATGITATLDSIGTKMVLGVPDSVMYISMSNNHSIQLSRDHGFVYCFSFLPFVNLNMGLQTIDLDLWGIPEMALGDTLPGVHGVFDYDIGDRFGKRKYESFYQSYTPTTSYIHTEITGKTPGANGVQYNTLRERFVMFPFGSSYYPPGPLTVNIDYNNYPFLNLLPYESVPGSAQGNQVQVGVNFSSDFNGRVEYLFQNIIYYDPCIPALLWFEDESKENYAEGLGQTYWSYLSLAQSEYEWMYCYDKVLDSLAPCADLSVLNGIEDGLDGTITMAIGPVPTRDQLQVEIENYHGFGSLDLAIVDLQGRTVREMHLPSGQTRTVMDVRELKSGMYALQIRGKDGTLGWKKFVVQR